MFAYFTGNIWAVWLIIAIVCMIVELTSFDFFITCFAIGALGAMLVSFTGCPLWVDVVVWAIVSVLSLCFVRPVLTKYLHHPSHKRKSNADALIGRHGVVTEKINPHGYGYVRIDGDEWRSVTLDGSAIEAGTNVEVVARESIILTVKQV